MENTIQKRLLTEQEAARYLGLSRSFLRKSRMDGPRKACATPPPFVRTGRLIRYDIEDLDQWIAAHREGPVAPWRGRS